MIAVVKMFSFRAILELFLASCKFPLSKSSEALNEKIKAGILQNKLQEKKINNRSTNEV